MTVYYLFPNPAAAFACSGAILYLQSPPHLFPQNVSRWYSQPIVLPDGRAALPLDMSGSIVIHKHAAESGYVEVLIANLAGPPNETDLANWAGVEATLAALPERGDPILNGLEPVISVPLAALMPVSAVVDLLTQEQLDALLSVPEPEEPE